MQAHCNFNAQLAYVLICYDNHYTTCLPISTIQNRYGIYIVSSYTILCTYHSGRVYNMQKMIDLFEGV